MDVVYWWYMGQLKLASRVDGLEESATLALNAALPSQQAGLAALAYGDKPVMLDVLGSQRTLVDSKLRAIPKLKYTLPGGAFYFFIDVRAITKNSLEWCEQLLDTTGVALVPGEAFGAPGFVRLSFVADLEVLTAALERLQQFIERGSDL